MAAQPSRFPVMFKDESKSRNAYIQVSQVNGAFKIQVFEHENSKRVRHEYALHDAYAEMSLQDISNRTVSVTTPTHIVHFTFASADDAIQNLQTFNMKSDVYKDIVSVQNLENQFLQNWPFPKNDLLC